MKAISEDADIADPLLQLLCNYQAVRDKVAEAASKMGGHVRRDPTVT